MSKVSNALWRPSYVSTIRLRRTRGLTTEQRPNNGNAHAIRQISLDKRLKYHLLLLEAANGLRGLSGNIPMTASTWCQIILSKVRWALYVLKMDMHPYIALTSPPMRSAHIVEPASNVVEVPGPRGRPGGKSKGGSTSPELDIMSRSWRQNRIAETRKESCGNLNKAVEKTGEKKERK